MSYYIRVSISSPKEHYHRKLLLANSDNRIQLFETEEQAQDEALKILKLDNVYEVVVNERKED